MQTEAALEVGIAQGELNRRLAAERGRYYVPNGRIEQFLNAIGDRFEPGSKRIWIVILRAGNSIGKSCLAANLASYLADSYENPYFDAVPYLRYFKRPNRGRILTTRNAAENNYDAEFVKWLRRGQYKSMKQGRNFESRYEFKNGSEFDLFTFDQAPAQGESITLRWAIVDEPMSRRHWTALKSRFRFGGIIFMLLTPLKGAGWYHFEFETPERMANDVLIMEGSSEDACIQHGIRGIVDHETLEDQWRDFDADELPTRRDGKYLELAGSIYKTYRDDAAGHIMTDLPAYYRDCWDKGFHTLWQGIDPHDRKPWAITWRTYFPNGKSIGACEWPDESMQPFHKIKHWGWGWDAYAKMTVETEKALGAGHAAYATVFDPNYGPKATMDVDGVTSHAAEFAAAYRKLTGQSRRMMFPSDDISSGHIAVKGLLGDPARGVTPGMYWLEHLRNGRFGMVNYGYKENKDEKKGLGELPELQFKDFPDTERYLAKAKARYIDPSEELPADFVLQSPGVRANGRFRV